MTTPNGPAYPDADSKIGSEPEKSENSAQGGRVRIDEFACFGATPLDGCCRAADC